MYVMPVLTALQGPLVLSVEFERIWRAKGALEIPVGRRPQRVSLRLPPVAPREGKVVCLRFAARLTTKGPGGWNQYLAVIVNGSPAGPLTKGGKRRLLNWPTYVRSAHPSEPRVALYGRRSGLPCLLVFFTSDISQVDPRILENRREGCWYLLDVSDLLRSGGPNELTFVNTAVEAYWPRGVPEGLKLSIESLELGYVPEREVGRLRGAGRKERRFVKGPTATREGNALTVAPGGGLEVRSRGEIYFVESSFTCLKKRRELLSLPTARGWKVKIRQLDGANFEVSAGCEEFRLLRRVRHEGHRISVEDELTNLTDEVIGIIVRHEIIVPGGMRDRRLGGVEEDFRKPRRMPENPAAFVSQKRSGLGLVAEENVMRLQMGGEVVGNRVCVFLENFGLRPHGSHKLKFALYPVGPDYFEFVNSIRRDWGVNFTILGPFEFVDARQFQKPEDAEKLRALLERKRIRIFALGPWFEYYNGYNLSREEYKALMRRAMGVIKSVLPEAICIARLETNLCPVPLDFFGGTLPPDLPFGRPGTRPPVGKPPGVYGWPAPPEATEVVNRSPWGDSVLRDQEGRVLLDTWYVQSYLRPPALNLMVYPRVGNYRHKLGLEQLRFLLDDVGLDGVYFDQFSLAYGTRDRFTYDFWDGHTVDIDPETGRVTRRYADLGLVSAGARRDWVEFVLKRGKVVVANSMPAVMELQPLRTFRFMETQGYDPLSEGPPDQPRCAKGQLASPIGLGYQWGRIRERKAESFVRTVCAHLRYGLLYYYYCTDFPPEEGGFGPVNHMFPFTPVALHEGWVEGRERIVTCVSGEFKWPKPNKPKVRLFDDHGREREGKVEVRPSDGKWIVKIELRDWWEVAVIEGEEP